MKRFMIIMKINLLALYEDPIPILGGLIAPLVMMVAFGVLFGGNLSFKIAVIDQDQGEYGQQLRETFDEVISPLNSKPYYAVQDLTVEEAWREYERMHIDAVWLIPADFSQRLLAGQKPSVEMYFNNYNDDRAKNHRIYSSEILWHFYEKIGLEPGFSLAEEYPLPRMIDWFPIIGVGIVLTAVVLGAMFNAYILTFREARSGITLEFGLMPRSLLWVFVPKTILALLMGLATGTLVLFILYLWVGAWPSGAFLIGFWQLSGLCALFWLGFSTLLGLGVRDYFFGAVVTILSTILVFFISGGMSLVRYNREKVLLASWFFPNVYAIDPIRDLILFDVWPADFNSVILILLGFSVLGLGVGWVVGGRRLRRS